MVSKTPPHPREAQGGGGLANQVVGCWKKIIKKKRFALNHPAITTSASIIKPF